MLADVDVEGESVCHLMVTGSQMFVYLDVLPWSLLYLVETNYFPCFSRHNPLMAFMSKVECS